MQTLMPPVDSPDGYFHDGNPATGDLGTIVAAEWLNDVQDATRSLQAEVLSVLADAGITADPAKADQLLDAIQSLISEGAGDISDTSLAAHNVATDAHTDIRSFATTEGNRGRDEADATAAAALSDHAAATTAHPDIRALATSEANRGRDEAVASGQADMAARGLLNAAAPLDDGTDVFSLVVPGNYVGSGLLNAPNADSWHLQVIAQADTTFRTYIARAVNAPFDTYTGVVNADVFQGWDRSFTSRNMTFEF